MKIYNILYRPISNLIGLFLLPVALFNKRIKEHTVTLIPKMSSSFWFHASSVGEINGIKPLVKKILDNYPTTQIVISTMTPTGKKTAQQISEKIITTLVPFDSSVIVKRFIKRINPQILVIAETELWFAMINECKKKNIPILLANARISKTSFPRYLKHKSIFSPLLNKIDKIVAQAEIDLERFKQLGAKNVVVGGNLKFCVSLPLYDSDSLRQEYKYQKDDIIITWGSSRPGEEVIMINNFFQLKQEFPKLRLILVLRHINRVNEVTQILEKEDYATLSNFQPGKDILIVDEMGVLNKFYAISNISIVGGSFVDFGGHNPLEPAFYGKAIIIGQYHTSCQDSVDKLTENQAVLISNSDKLVSDLRNLLSDLQTSAYMGNKAKKTLSLNDQALEKNYQEFVKLHQNFGKQKSDETR